MGDHPAKAFQQKADSSITVGFAHLAKGAIQGFASAGSTGAMMVGSMQVIKPIDGIIRPTISSLVPTVAGRPALLLDVGLNVDCKPEVLNQYSLVIGSIYAERVGDPQSPWRFSTSGGDQRQRPIQGGPPRNDGFGRSISSATSKEFISSPARSPT